MAPKARPLRTRVQRIVEALDLSVRENMHLAQLLHRAEETLCIEGDTNQHGAGVFCQRVARLEVHLGLDI